MERTSEHLQSRRSLRNQIIQQARNYPASLRAQETIRVQERVWTFLAAQEPASLGVFLPMPHEVDCLPVYEKLLERGWRLFLPVCIRLSDQEASHIAGFGAGTPWMRWAPLTRAMIQEVRFWTQDEPVPGNWVLRFGCLLERPLLEAKPVGWTPTWLQVPALVYRPDGYRLGHGGGYYDRLLSWIEQNRLEHISFAVPASWQLGLDFEIQPWDRKVQYCLL